MKRTINFALLLSLCCFVTSVFVINWSPDDPTSYASSFLPEKNSTASNSSANSIESNPITTIIIPTKGSSLASNSTGNNVPNLTESSAPHSNSSSSFDTSSGVKNQSDLVSSDDTLKANVSNEVTNNDTISDSQQRGKYLTDDNGIHFYNINNCSEKKGSSGIGNLSECEDAAKEMSQE